MGVPAPAATGIKVSVAAPSPETQAVLTDIVLERHRQIKLHGHNEDTLDGTGPDVRWALGLAVDIDGTLHADTCPATYGATALEEMIRARYDRRAAQGQPLTWVDFLLEEMAEAFKEEDPAKLYTELSQVGAVVVSWMEKIRQR